MTEKKSCKSSMVFDRYLDRCIKKKLSDDAKLVDGIIGWDGKKDIKTATQILDTGYKHRHGGDGWKKGESLETASTVIGHRFVISEDAVVRWYKEKYNKR